MKPLNLREIDYRWYEGVQIDFDTEYDCRDYGCEDYCRCGRIKDARVYHVDLVTLLSSFFLNSEPLKDRLRTYCYLKLLSPLAELENWEVEVEGGYYGEEIGKVSYTGPDIDLASLREQDNTNLMANTLMSEYGYLLQSLVDKTPHLRVVHLKDVMFPNLDYSKKVSLNKVREYEEMDLDNMILGVLRSNSTLIDGYHRTTAALNKKIKKGTFIVYE